MNLYIHNMISKLFETISDWMTRSITGDENITHIILTGLLVVIILVSLAVLFSNDSEQKRIITVEDMQPWEAEAFEQADVN